MQGIESAAKSFTDAIKLMNHPITTPVTSEMRKKEVKVKKMASRKDVDVNQTLFLQPDTAQFCATYLDPFRTKPASLPVTPLLSHQSIRTYVSGKGITNAQGNAWVNVIPGNMAVNDGDVPSVTYTTGSGASDAMAFGLSVGGATAASSNSPYSAADFAYEPQPQLMMRIVALGIRVRYLGTYFNAGGTCYTVEVEAKTPISSVTGWNITNIKQQPGWKEYTFRDASWHSVIRTIQSEADFQYQVNDSEVGWIYANVGAAGSSLTTQDSTNNIAIYMASGVAAQPYEFEVSAHFEIVGQNLPERKVVKNDRHIVENLASVTKAKRFMNTTTLDHAVGKNPTGPGGFVSFLKEAGKSLLPMIPEIIGAFL